MLLNGVTLFRVTLSVTWTLTIYTVAAPGFFFFLRKSAMAELEICLGGK